MSRQKIILFILLIFTVLNSCKEKVTLDPIAREAGVDETYYTEPHRPQFHFSPESMWMNDPNGMVFYEDEYHLFYQYYPDSTVWGPMHWGHAVSEDLVHWSHLPIALYPDSLGYIFSGSAVIDWNNTSGFGSADNPPMVAFFTHHNAEGKKAARDDFQYQSIAYSLDKGRTWTKYEGNPVIPNPGMRDFRDPKVIWDRDRNEWIMVFAAYDNVRFYTSPNLINWNYKGSFGIEGDTRLWECPDFFPLVANDGKKKWILITSIAKEGPNGGTATSYFVGDYNGQRFIADSGNQKWLDYGTDNYAMVTWSDANKDDQSRIGLGWMSNWQYAQTVPTQKWRSAMTLPRKLSLHYEKGDYMLLTEPVKEIESIEEESQSLENKIYSETTSIVDSSEHHLYKVHLKFKKPEEGLVQINIANSKGELISLGYQASNNEYFIDRTFSGYSDFSDVFADYHTAPLSYDDEEVDITFYLDWSSLELFADDGRIAMTEIFFPSEPYDRISIITENNEVELLEGSVTKLDNIWR